MATNTQIITGFIVRPNGEPFVAGTIKFTLTGTDTDNDEVIARDKSAQFPIEDDGSVAVELWSNTRGSVGSFYTVQVREGDVGYFETVGRIQVPDAGPYDLATLMRADIPAAQKTFYSVLTQEEYDAFLADMDGKLSDMDGKLVTGSGYVDAALDHKNEAAASAALALGYKDDVASAIVYQDLAAIAATIAGTAVDYDIDTSPNPSLAVQRQTSWYNEPLNTATRGARRELPTNKVWVAEGYKLTMLDGDDPSFPMWAIYNHGGTEASGVGSEWWYNVPVASISAVGGKVFFTTNAGSSNRCGLMTIDFANDIKQRLSSNPVLSGTWFGAKSGVTSGAFDLDIDVVIAHYYCNSVNAHVYPWSPIDPVSGLQIPTIAVGTGGGVSIIDGPAGVGTVVDITCSNVTFTASSYARLLDDGGLELNLGKVGTFYTGSYLYRFASIPTEDTVITLNTKLATGDAPYAFYSTSKDIPALYGDLPLNTNNLWTSPNAPHFGANNAFAGGPYVKGFTLLSENKLEPSKGMVAYITSSYNTGWMGKGCLGALLCSTDTTSLSGAVLNANSDFSSGITGWSATGSGFYTFATGSVTFSVGGISAIYPTTTVTAIGETVLIRVVVDSISTGFVGPSFKTGSVVGTDYITSAGTYEFLATVENNAQVYFRSEYSDAVVSEVSIIRGDYDRSVKNKGVIVHGTVTRTPVATGAELMGYGGFSATNYLEQPYNPDLDFGTGDFCVMGWVNEPSGTGTRAILDRADAVDAAGRFHLYMDSITGQLKALVGGVTLTSTEEIDTGSLVFITYVRRSGVGELWVNGALSKTATQSADLTNATAYMDIGVNRSKQYAMQGSVALLRISNTAPSAEQIAKIYNDEKRMFQEDAACTLYGTSDEVTALAHDSVTGLIHPCTSQGRSDFSGLIRVGNTTTAVTTAIAAHDGLILEQ